MPKNKSILTRPVRATRKESKKNKKNTSTEKGDSLYRIYDIMFI
jgi:hypothetical protein